MSRFLLFISFVLLSSSVSTQNSVGLLSYDPSKAYDGYNLFFPHNQSTVFLINNCGEIVHSWEDETDFRPGNVAYLRTDGSIVKAKRNASVSGDAIWAGGGGAIIEIRDWNNNLEWSYELNNEDYRLHHDIAPLDNGNILALAWERKSREESIEAGRDSMKMDQNEVWSEYVFEIDPSTNDIVWEWHVWDHLVQDFDSTKANYGIVSDHPELININYDTHDGHPDWLHINAMDYSEERKQILLSVPYFDEVWIVDHTTDTEDAAGSTGGFSNRGGDLMFRWGNPAAYNVGDISEKKLFFQHDAHFIDDFIFGNNFYFNSIALFNNRVGEDFSTINVIKPSWEMYDWEYKTASEPGGTFLPLDFSVTKTHPDPQQLYSTGLSSVQLLPNENYLIASGRFGYSFELTPDDEIVWEYKTPLIGGTPATQGDSLSLNNNLTFRMKRYPASYDAFEDRDLSAKGFIELEPNTTFCDELLDVTVLEDDYALAIFPNPTSEYIVIDWDANMYTYLKVYDATGQEIVSLMRTGGRTQLDVSDWTSGTYTVQIDGVKAARFIVTK